MINTKARSIWLEIKYCQAVNADAHKKEVTRLNLITNMDTLVFFKSVYREVNCSCNALILA